MRTLLDAARQRMRHTQKALQTDTAVLLEKLLHMFASFGRSALLKPRRERIGRRSVYHSRRIALSSPNSSCAQENSAYGTSLFIRIYSVAFLTSVPSQTPSPLPLRTPRACTETSGCQRKRETSRKAQTDNSAGTACRPPSRPHNRYRRRHSYILPCTPTDSPSPPSAYRTVYPAGTACA